MLGGNLEIIVDFLSFRNIDLYEQGYYAIRVQLSSENSEIVQPYLVLSPNNGEGIQDSTFCTRTFDISYSDQYIELDNSCLFRIFYQAYPNKNPKITVKCELLYSITEAQLTPVSSFECNIQSGCDGQQQGIDVVFDSQHFCTARLYIYTIVLGYRYTGADFQDFVKAKTQNYEQNEIDNLITNYVDSLYSIQMKYKNLLIQIINLQKDRNMQIQQLMKIPVVQTAKFKTTLQIKTFGEDFLQIVNQLGQTLFQLWYHFQTLLKGCRSYLLEAVDPRILQNCKKQAAEHVLSSQVSFVELQSQLNLPILRQREDVWQQARKTQVQYTVVLQDNNYAMGNPFIFEDLFTDGQLQRSQKKHVIVLAHGYQGTSMDMQIWKNFLRIKFPNHLIIQSQINEDDTEDSILSMSYKLSQEITQLISDRVPTKQLISLSFIGHSLGGVLIRAALPHLQKFQDCMHTYISLASPHVGLGVQQSSIIDAGLWMMKAFSKEKKVCLNQMTLSDDKDLSKTCIFKLSQNSRLCWFKNAIFAFSPQDQYVPFSAASLSKVEPSNARENLHNQMVDSILESPPQTIIKSTVFFPNMKNALDKMIGRAAHIEFIDNPNFIRFNNLSPTQELQAIQEVEFEQEYLNTGLRGSPAFINSKSTQTQIDTKRADTAPIWTQRAQKTGVSLMAFFFVKRFVQKIRSHRQKLQNINEQHLQLIGDQASDNQVMLTQMKFASPIFQIKNVSRLFRQQTFIMPESRIIGLVKDKYQMLRKYAYEKLSKFPQFHPESPKKLLFDYFISIIRIILLILIPLEIAYTPGIAFRELRIFTMILTTLLALEILIRLNTICYVKGHAVLDRFEIVRQQFNNLIFIDFATLAPLYYFLSKTDTSQYHLLVLLTSLTQFKYINNVIQKSEESQYFTKSQKGIISLFKLILTLMYILHIFSCIWYFNSALNPQGWIQFKGLDTQDWQSQYLEAFYFAIVTMLTIGYGDNVPKTPNEKILAIIFIMGACLWFSYSVNTIGIIIKDINQNMVERIKRIRVINRYMHKRNIPYGLQYRIREYLNFRWKVEAEIDLQQEEQLLEELSEELKQELKQQSNSVFFSHCSFLSSNFSLEFQNALSCHITRKIIQPQNTFSIFTLCPTKQPHLCFVEQGQLQYLNCQRLSLKGIQCQGQFLQVQDFVTENENTQTFKAIGYVSLLTLSKSDFLSVINNFPKDYQQYCQLKDTIKLSVRKKQLDQGVYCPACKLSEHDLIGCPQLRLTIDREVVVKRHLFSKPQERTNFRRSQSRTKHLFQTLPDQDIIEQFTVYFQNEKTKLIKTQLQHQLVFEPDNEDNPMKSDHNISAPQEQQLLLRKQDSILLSQNFSSSNNLPQPISPIHSMMVHSQRPKQGILDSQSSYDNHRPPKRQNYDFDLKPPINKYTTAKLSMYKKNYLSKYQQQQQSQMDLEQNVVQEFNEMIQQQIEQLYMKMRRLAISEQLENIFDFLDIEMLYLQYKSEQGLDQFEAVKSYELYMVTNNINRVISKVISPFIYLNKLIYYMYFPFEYVMKFQKLQQQRERSLKSIRQPPKKPGLSISKIVELKNVFHRKRVTHRRSIKISQVNPDSEV